MKNKKFYFISFFLLLIGMFIFLEWQINVEEKKICEPGTNGPKAHIAIGR